MDPGILEPDLCAVIALPHCNVALVTQPTSGSYQTGPKTLGSKKQRSRESQPWIQDLEVLLYLIIYNLIYVDILCLITNMKVVVFSYSPKPIDVWSSGMSVA